MINLLIFIVAFYIGYKINDWMAGQDETVQEYQKAYQAQQKPRLRSVDLETGEVKQDLELLKN